MKKHLVRFSPSVLSVAAFLLAAALPAPLPADASGDVFADFRKPQSDGSVYRVPREDWEGARRRVAEDPDWTQWVAERRAVLDGWMARRRDRAEWTAGRGHSFVSPTDGAFLIWTPDIPGEDVPVLKSRTGEAVSVTPTIFEAWVDKFRKRHVEMIAEAARFHRLTGDERYAEWVAGQLDFYGDNLAAGAWQVSKGHSGRLGVMPFNDGVMMTHLTEAARLVFDSPVASPERRRAWFEKLFLPEWQLFNASSRSLDNKTLWVRVAQAQIAMLYRDDALLAPALEGPGGVRDLFARGVTGDYFWFEQSMLYHDFLLMGVQPLLTFAALTGHADRIRAEATVAQNMMLATLQIRFPDGTLPNPADTTRTDRAPSHRLRANYRTLPTTIGLEAVYGIRSWDTLVDPPSGVAPSIPARLPDVVSRHFESTRFALLKKNPWQVFLHYGQVASPHSQKEALNWSAYFGDTRITADPGNVGYGSKLYGVYYSRGLHHNVPLVDGEGQQKWARGQLSRFDPVEGVMTALQTTYRQNVSAARTLWIDGDTLLDEVTLASADDAASTARHGLALHLYGRPLWPDSKSADRAGFAAISMEAFSKGRPPAFRHWKNVRVAAFQDRAEIDVEFSAGLVMRVAFELKGGGAFTLYQGDSPDLPPHTRAGFYIETDGSSAETTFLTTLRPAPSSAR